MMDRTKVERIPPLPGAEGPKYPPALGMAPVPDPEEAVSPGTPRHPDETTDIAISYDKFLRKRLDSVLQELKAGIVTQHGSRERSLAATKIEEAIMWLAMDVKALAGGKSCYKHGYDPESPVVEPTDDGLEL